MGFYREKEGRKLFRNFMNLQQATRRPDVPEDDNCQKIFDSKNARRIVTPKTNCQQVGGFYDTR
jgi:hypothetical protein